MDATPTTETLSIGGKDFPCTVVKITLTHPQARTHIRSKMWRCPDVPGGLAKSEYEYTRGQLRMGETMVVEAWGTPGK